MTNQPLAGAGQTRARLAGAALVVGTVVFCLGSFTPVPIDYTGPVAEQYVDVQADMTVWLVSHVLYLGGIGLTAAGLYGLATLFEATRARMVALAGVVLHALALATFTVGTYARVTLPGTSTTVPPLFEAAMAGWLFVLYSVLTLGAFGLVGAALVTGSTTRRLGWYVVGGSLGMIVVFAVLGDLPPLLFYLLTLPIGVSLVRRPRHRLAAVGE